MSHVTAKGGAWMLHGRTLAGPAPLRLSMAEAERIHQKQRVDGAACDAAVEDVARNTH